LSSNDELISLREKSSAILSLLTVVASRPAKAAKIHEDETLCGLLSDFNGEHNNCDVATFYAFLKSEFLRDKEYSNYSNINHLDALLRCSGIRKFFHEDLGLHEAWILFVDIKDNVEQLWLKDRANSVVFPEKDRDINEKRIEALQKRNGKDKQLLNTSKPEQIDKVTDGLLKKHLYRKWLARFLIEKNNAQFAGSTVSGGSLLKLIPAFNFFGTKDRIKKRRNIEQKNLILLSTPKEYWDAIGKKRSDNAATCYPFDAFVLDALFAHESSAPDDDSELLFFSFPLDPVDLTKNGNTREHGALWSGFLLVTKTEAALLESKNQGISNGDYAKLIWRIRTLRSALNILGQPCVRKQLEIQIAISLGRKHAQMVDLTRTWVEKITGNLQQIERETQHLHSIYFAPYTAVFAAAPRLQRLFEKDALTTIGTVLIKGLHNETAEENVDKFKDVISAALVHILAGDTRTISSKECLWEKAEQLIANSKDPVVPICKAIINTDGSLPGDRPQLRRAFQCIKQIGHTPFKPEDSKWPLLPLAFTFIYGSGHKLTSLEFTCNKNGESVVFKGTHLSTYRNNNDLFGFEAPHLMMGFGKGQHYFPIIQYSHFLDFVGGVLSYAVAEANCKTITGKVNVAGTDECCIKICFGNDNSLINPKKFKTVLSGMGLIVQKGLRYPSVYGDFKKPFMTLAERCALGTRANIDASERGITLHFNAYRVNIINDVYTNCLEIVFKKEDQR
jgi:hypothetical protein